MDKIDHKAQKERIDNGYETKYSEDLRDLANIRDYGAFLSELTNIFVNIRRVLKNGKYCAIILSDFRHGKKYYMFHSDVAQSLENCGYCLKGITILHQKHKSVYPYGYPVSFVPNIHHQYILILQNIG